MMFTDRSKCVLDEINGLTQRQSKMYMLAWKHNKECFGYMGLCELWGLKISPNIRLKDVAIVLDRLLEHGFFNTNAYYELTKSLIIINDHIPGIYKESWEALNNECK